MRYLSTVDCRQAMLDLSPHNDKTIACQVVLVVNEVALAVGATADGSDDALEVGLGRALEERQGADDLRFIAGDLLRCGGQSALPGAQRRLRYYALNPHLLLSRSLWNRAALHSRPPGAVLHCGTE